MQVTVENVGPCKKLLKIEVPAEKVTEELDKTYRQLNDGVVVPGFRRGHAPRWLMESRFGKQVNDDAKQALITSSFEDAVKQNELRPIGAPKFDETIEFAAAKPLAFGVTIEVRPEFEIDDYATLELEKPSAEPTKAEIDEHLETVRRRYAKLEEVKDGSPRKDDVVLCHVVLREGDAPYRDIPNHQFIVGDHILVGLSLDETTELVTSAKLGDAVERKVKLPEQYPDAGKRGAEMTLALTLEGIRRPALPRLTEQWAKEVGFDSVDDLRNEVKTAVQREKDRQARTALEEQLAEELLKKVDFDLPADIIQGMADRTLFRRSLGLRYQGVPMEEIDKRLEELKAESRQTAEKAAKLFFILDKIADKERLFVTEDEVTARVEALAANYNRAPDQVHRELEQNDRLSELRAEMREEKVRQFLIDKATIKEAKTATKKTAKSKE